MNCFLVGLKIFIKYLVLKTLCLYNFYKNNYQSKKINKNYRDYLVIKKDFKPEYSILVSNPSVINSIGWKPKTDFHQLADLMMESYDRNH